MRLSYLMIIASTVRTYIMRRTGAFVIRFRSETGKGGPGPVSEWEKSRPKMSMGISLLAAVICIPAPRVVLRMEQTQSGALFATEFLDESCLWENVKVDRDAPAYWGGFRG